jgi:ribosomal protein S18 acetylase RimI-like enzyme
MISIRQMLIEDILEVQNCNIQCLPENYQVKYYVYHLISWPACSFVAIDLDYLSLVGYILGKLEENQEQINGHITSIAIFPDYRNKGVASKLMEKCLESFIKNRAVLVTLHVRKSNTVALALYEKKFMFEVINEEKKYYADGESALLLRRKLTKD